MELPKKKSIQDLRAGALGEADYLRKAILDSEGMMILADELVRVYYLASENNNRDFLEIIKFLRGE